MIINDYERELLSVKGALSVISSSGAIGYNKPGYIDIAIQREALWVLRYGMLIQSKDHVSRAVRAFEYGFNRQNPAGYFINTIGISPEIAVGGDAFFMSAYCIAYFMLKNEPAYTEEFARLEILKPKLILAMTWLDRNKATLLQQDDQTPNRLLFDATAFYLSSQITNHEDHKKLGEMFIAEALRAQVAEGYFIEKGGWDSSYQAVSMLNLCELYYDCNDESLKQVIIHSLGLAADWLISRIDENGVVSAVGNSRTGLGQEVHSGKEKEINLAEVAESLFGCGNILGDKLLTKVAEKVVQSALT